MPCAHPRIAKDGLRRGWADVVAMRLSSQKTSIRDDSFEATSETGSPGICGSPAACDVRVSVLKSCDDQQFHIMNSNRRAVDRNKDYGGEEKVEQELDYDFSQVGVLGAAHQCACVRVRSLGGRQDKP